jgi:hypothetical protein
MLITHYATCRISNLWLLLAARIAMAGILYLAVMKIAHAKILDDAIRYLSRR